MGQCGGFPNQFPGINHAQTASPQGSLVREERAPLRKTYETILYVRLRVPQLYRDVLLGHRTLDGEHQSSAYDLPIHSDLGNIVDAWGRWVETGKVEAAFGEAAARG